MPTYLFTIADGRLSPEVHWVHLEDLGAARMEAAQVLGALIQHEPDKFWSTMNFQVSVADDKQITLFELRAIATDDPNT